MSGDNGSGKKNSSGLNKVFIMGNLVREPDLRQLPSGSSVASMRVAINDSVRNAEGKFVDLTCYVDVVAWTKLGETCAGYLGKGSPVLIEGRMYTEEWETKDGEKRSQLKVRADRVKFLGKPRNAGRNHEQREPAMAGGDDFAEF